MLSPLHITVLGHFTLRVADHAVSGAWPPRLPELITQLVLAPQQAHLRRDLAFLLWPDTGESQAQANLRKLLHQLRGSLPELAACLQLDAQHFRWPTDATCTCDLIRFDAALAHAAHAQAAGDEVGRISALQQAVTLYGGDLLQRADAEWLLPVREQVRRRFFAALEALILLLERRRDYRAAIEAAHRLVTADPLHETSYRYLMRLYSAHGDRAGALRVYHTCSTVLQRELGVEPSPATRLAYAALVAGGSAGPDPHLPAPPQLVAAPELVGRQSEWAQLQAVWQAAQAGRSKLVVLVGDGGIGKTRLAEELVAWAARQGIATATAHCYAAEQGLAYAPVITWLRAGRGPTLAAPWQQELGRVLPELSDGTPPVATPAHGGQQRLFEALAQALLAVRPRMCLLDDIQWADPESLVWLPFLLRFDPHAPLLIVATLRPEEIGPDHPLAAMLTALQREERVQEIALGPLDATATACLAAAIAGGAVPPAIAARLYRETEGNPLLVVEMVRGGLEAPPTVPAALPRPPRSASGLPPRVQALLQARLAPLSAEGRRRVVVPLQTIRPLRAEHRESATRPAAAQRWQIPLPPRRREPVQHRADKLQ